MSIPVLKILQASEVTQYFDGANDMLAFLDEHGISREGTDLEHYKTKNTANNDGVRFDIRKDIHGNKFVLIEGSFASSDTEAKEIASTLSKIVKNNFAEFVDVSGQKIGVNQKTAREWQWSKDAQYLYANDKQKYIDKMNALENADELLLISRDYIAEANKHSRKDKFVMFARGKVDLMAQDRGYSADIIVGTTKSGVRVLYDLVGLEDKKIEVASHTAQSRRAETTSDSIISQDDTSVNNQSMQKSERDSQENGDKKLYQARPDFEDILFDDFDGEVTDSDARLITEYINGKTDVVNHLINNIRSIPLSEHKMRSLVSRLLNLCFEK